MNLQLHYLQFAGHRKRVEQSREQQVSVRQCEEKGEMHKGEGRCSLFFNIFVVV